jgi:hypothetical protein
MTTTTYKIGDKINTTQDNFGEVYQGVITEIKRMPHPYTSNDKLITFYRVEGIVNGVRKNFLTSDIK